MALALRVVDTSAWIEWLVASAVGTALRDEFPDKSQWVVPTVIQLELSKWLLRERSEAESDRVIAFTQKYIVVPLDTGLACLRQRCTGGINWQLPMRSFMRRRSSMVQPC